jgi:hypothetical protein
MTGVLKRESCTRIARQIGILIWGYIYSVVVGRGLIGRKIFEALSTTHASNVADKAEISKRSLSRNRTGLKFRNSQSGSGWVKSSPATPSIHFHSTPCQYSCLTQPDSTSTARTDLVTTSVKSNKTFLCIYSGIIRDPLFKSRPLAHYHPPTIRHGLPFKSVGTVTTHRIHCECNRPAPRN